MTDPIIQNWTGLPVTWQPNLNGPATRIPVTGQPLTITPKYGELAAASETGSKITITTMQTEAPGLPPETPGILLLVTRKTAARNPRRRDLIIPAGHTIYDTQRILCTDLLKVR